MQNVCCSSAKGHQSLWLLANKHDINITVAFSLLGMVRNFVYIIKVRMQDEGIWARDE